MRGLIEIPMLGRGVQVDQIAFIALRAEYATVTETYLREAKKTSLMLGRCTTGPLSFEERLALLSQEILEMDAFRLYLHAKRFLHSAAVLGYGGLSTN
jgi:hypothetical protein